MSFEFRRVSPTFTVSIEQLVSFRTVTGRQSFYLDHEMMSATVELAKSKKILDTSRPKIELLRERFIEAKLPQVFLLDVTDK